MSVSRFGLFAVQIGQLAALSSVQAGIYMGTRYITENTENNNHQESVSANNRPFSRATLADNSGETAITDPSSCSKPSPH